LAVSSANPAGEPAPASFEEIGEGLFAKVRLAVDGGKCGSGRPSTVVEIRRGGLKVLRQGEMCEDELIQALFQYGEN
jgi:tRNA A37 threonylcarbamoyladenosine synthetase subunit TsaC/SUA5/YrdC